MNETSEWLTHAGGLPDVSSSTATLYSTTDSLSSRLIINQPGAIKRLIRCEIRRIRLAKRIHVDFGARVRMGHERKEGGRGVEVWGVSYVCVWLVHFGF
jgi:hypothetical protein